MAFLNELDHLRIPFGDIKVATNNFTTIIGEGGYGPVYEGKLILAGNLTRVAVKRLRDQSGQGFKEFLTEINLLSVYKHPNLVSLLGFCQEGDEKILIYEYAERGSFDNYLNTVNPLTWRQRLNICVDAARGLDYLHNRVGADHRIIHRDIKSSNILLDENFTAKIADLGLSKIGRANEKQTFVITVVGGTLGYFDPEYFYSGILTKKSDVYSFGVVLFEALCGRLCIIDPTNRKTHLVPLVRRLYAQGKLNEIMDLDLKHSESVKEFSEIAYHCLHDDREERPSMDLVLQNLEKAFELQETYELQEFVEALVLQEVLEAMELQGQQETSKLQEFVEALVLQEVLKVMEAMELRMDTGTIRAIHMISDTHRPNYATIEEIYTKLSSGILLDDRKVWLSIDENGKNQELISAMKFMPPDSLRNAKWYSGAHPTCVFTEVARTFPALKFNVEAKIIPQFLSSNVLYAAYLVCKAVFGNPEDLKGLKYKLNNRSQSHYSYPMYFYEHDWVMIELFQTNSLERDVEFKVLLEEFECPKSKDVVIIQGIVFLPIKKFDDEKIKIEDMEKLLPGDYKQFIYYGCHSDRVMDQKSQNFVITETREEAYAILSRGVHIKLEDDYNAWFWITKLNGKKCFLLSASSIGTYAEYKPSSPNESRFTHVMEIQSSVGRPDMLFVIKSYLLSTNTSYACYLVYNTPPDSVYLVDVKTKRYTLGYKSNHNGLLHLGRSQSLVVIGPDGDVGEGEGTPGTIINQPLIRGQPPTPSKREDGWLEVPLWNFTTYEDSSIQKNYPKSFSKEFHIFDADHDYGIWMYFTFKNHDHELIRSPSLMVQGLEFRPL